MFENLLNPIFAPLLKLPSLFGILIISLIITVLVTLIYKWTTDQSLMKQLKDEIKEFQKEIKTLRNDPQKAMQVQKKAMETNMKYMMQSFKPMIFTFIPIILIFGWLNSNMAYEPIKPDSEFTTTMIFNNNVNGEPELVAPEGINLNGDSKQKIIDGQSIWALTGKEGEYMLEYKFNNKSFTKDLLITNERGYKTPQKNIKDSEVKSIKIDNKSLKVLNLFGWRLGWLGTYIIVSIIFSIILRKVLKVY